MSQHLQCRPPLVRREERRHDGAAHLHLDSNLPVRPPLSAHSSRCSDTISNSRTLRARSSTLPRASCANPSDASSASSDARPSLLVNMSIVLLMPSLTTTKSRAARTQRDWATAWQGIWQLRHREGNARSDGTSRPVGYFRNEAARVCSSSPSHLHKRERSDSLHSHGVESERLAANFLSSHSCLSHSSWTPFRIHRRPQSPPPCLPLQSCAWRACEKNEPTR